MKITKSFRYVKRRYWTLYRRFFLGGWVFPYVSRIHTTYYRVFGFLHFRSLKLWVMKFFFCNFGTKIMKSFASPPPGFVGFSLVFTSGPTVSEFFPEGPRLGSVSVPSGWPVIHFKGDTGPTPLLRGDSLGMGMVWWLIVVGGWKMKCMKIVVTKIHPKEWNMTL